MAFRGVYPAPELKPTPCGLLSVARVTNHTASNYDERWVRGFAYEFDSYSTIRILSVNDENVSGGELFDAEGEPNYLDYQPFFIESEVFQSTFGLPGEDRMKEAIKQLEAATQKALEKELWDGIAAKAEENSNIYLAKASSLTIPAIGAYSAEAALFHLEQALADSPYGGNGVIHMTRDVASILGSKIKFDEFDPLPGERLGKLRTRLGTEVVVGSGYSGTGPDEHANATASATNRWMYATGPVEVHLSKPEIVNDTLAQGVNASINDMTIKAVRAAAVYFDPSSHYAVRVAVPALT